MEDEGAEGEGADRADGDGIRLDIGVDGVGCSIGFRVFALKALIEGCGQEACRQWNRSRSSS